MISIDWSTPPNTIQTDRTRIFQGWFERARGLDWSQRNAATVQAFAYLQEAYRRALSLDTERMSHTSSRRSSDYRH